MARPSTPSARGCSATRRSRPGVDPFFAPGHAGRPAGPAARADRRAAAPPPRDPRQPGAAAGQLRRPDRPPEGRDGDRRGLPPLRRARCAAAAEAPTTPRGHAPRASSSSRGLYADHDRLLAERGALDFGDLVLRAFRLLHEKPHVRERTAAALPARARGRVPGHELRAGDAAAPARGRAPQRDRGRRRRPGDLPLPRRVAEEPARLPARVPGRRRWSGSSATTAPAGASSTRPHGGGGAVSGPDRARSCAARAAAGCASGAAARSARRRRRWPRRPSG